MRVTLHPGAEADLAEAAGFYETQASPVLAARFIAEFKRVARLLLDNPGLGSARSRGRRSYPLRLFPHAVIYRQIDDGILILVVHHHRRHPGYGQRRSQISKRLGAQPARQPQPAELPLSVGRKEIAVALAEVAAEGESPAR